MDFNQANPYLAKLDVRQAIAAGTNRADMVNRIVGPITTSVKPLNNRIFMPNQPQFTDTSGGAGDFDPAKAKQLLQSAGMTMGSDGYFHPSSGPQAGKDLTFTISTTSGVPVRAEIEQLFQSYMKAIGIKINIQNYSPNTLFGTVGPKSEYDIIEFAWVATPFASANQSIYCSYTNANLCGQNWNHYANPRGRQAVRPGDGDDRPGEGGDPVQPDRRDPLEGHGDPAAVPAARADHLDQQLRQHPAEPEQHRAHLERPDLGPEGVLTQDASCTIWVGLTIWVSR